MHFAAIPAELTPPCTLSALEATNGSMVWQSEQKPSSDVAVKLSSPTSQAAAGNTTTAMRANTTIETTPRIYAVRESRSSQFTPCSVP